MARAEPITAVLIDLDGTLLHTAPDLAEAGNRALAEFGLPPVPLPLVERFIGQGIETLVRRCLGHLGETCDEARVAAVRSAYLRHYAAVNGTHARPYPGVLEGLDAMRAMGLSLGVCTNKLAAFSEPLLEKSNIAHYFSLVVSGDTTARRKPHADMLVHAANHWRTTVSSMLMIGDSGNDSAAARAAGCRVWLVPYGYNEGEPVQGLDCDGIVSSLDEAAARLRAGLA